MEKTLPANLLSIEETSKKFGFSISSIHKKASCRDWPCYKIGRRLFFDPEEISQLLYKKSRREVK